MGFQPGFDEDADFPWAGGDAGQAEVPWEGRRRRRRGVVVSLGDHHRELIATCERAGRQYDVVLLDIEFGLASPRPGSLPRAGDGSGIDSSLVLNSHELRSFLSVCVA